MGHIDGAVREVAAAREFFRRTLVAAGLLVCVSCGPNATGDASQNNLPTTPPDPHIQACTAAIKDSLLNPETAEILDMRELSADDIYSSRDMYPLRSALGDEHGTVAICVASEDANCVDKENERMWASIRAKSKWLTARVRAEGKLGNTITQMAGCSVESNNNCSCVFYDAT